MLKNTNGDPSSVDHSFMFRMVAFSEKHKYTIIVITILITVFLGYFATKIKIESSVRDLLPRNSKIVKLTEKYGGALNNTDFLVLAFEARGKLTLKKTTVLYKTIKSIEFLPDVHESLNPFNIVTFQKDGIRLKFTTLAKDSKPPQNEKDFKNFLNRLETDQIAKNLVISGDKTTLAVLFPVDSGVDYEQLLQSVRKILKGIQSSFDTYIAGQFPLDETTSKYLVNDVPRFLILALIVILLVYYFGFKTVRAVILPITTVSLGTLWTAGIMSLLGFKLTVVSMMTPPLVLTLGSSYSIHVLNQYYREATLKNNKIKWIAESVTHINKTIMMAALTTVIGFFSLISAHIRQIREFGIATSLGIIFCALLSLFFFPAVLSLLPPPTLQQKKRVTEGPVTRMLGRIGTNIIHWRTFILIGVVVIIALFLVSIKHVEYQTDFTKYYKKQEKAVDDNLFVVRKFGGYIYGYITLSGPKGKNNYFLDPKVLKKVSEFESRLRNNHDIAYISSFVTYLELMNKTITGRYEIPKNRGMILLLSRYFKALAATSQGSSVIGTVLHKNFNKITIAIRIYNSDTKSFMLEQRFKTFSTQLTHDEKDTLGPEIHTELWGNNLSAFYLSETLAHDQITSLLVSALLIFLLTSLAFRSFLFGLFALIPMAVGIMVNFICMYILKIPLDVVTITFSSVAIGVGVDTSIHLIIQFNRQRRSKHSDPHKILVNTLQIAGRPILLTTLSLVSGLLVLAFSSFTPIMFFGILVSLVLFTTAIGAIIVLPVFLSFFVGKR